MPRQFGIKIPADYRDWRLISVNHLAGGVKQVRAQLGNDIAIKAFRDAKLPFPDGTIIAAIHWNENSSDENNKVLASGFPGAGLQSFVAGSAGECPVHGQGFQKYAATGGWGNADFNGKPETRHSTKRAPPVTSPQKLTTMSSPATHVERGRRRPTRKTSEKHHGQHRLPTASPTRRPRAARRLQMTPWFPRRSKCSRKVAFCSWILLPLR